MSWTKNEKEKINRIEQNVTDLKDTSEAAHHMAARAEQLAWEHREGLQEIRDSLTGGLKAGDKPGWFTQIRLNTEHREGFRKVYLSVIGSTIFVAFATVWITFKDAIVNMFKGASAGGPPTP